MKEKSCFKQGLSHGDLDNHHCSVSQFNASLYETGSLFTYACIYCVHITFCFLGIESSPVI